MIASCTSVTFRFLCGICIGDYDGRVCRGTFYETRLTMRAEKMRNSEKSRKPTSRREHFRYPLRVPVTYRWVDGEVVNRSRGWTRNLSEEDAFVISGDCPVERSVVSLQFQIPRLRKPVYVPAVRMEMEADVVRVERDQALQTNAGFAVRKRKTAPAVDDAIPDEVWQRGYWAGSRAN